LFVDLIKFNCFYFEIGFLKNLNTVFNFQPSCSYTWAIIVGGDVLGYTVLNTTVV